MRRAGLLSVLLLSALIAPGCKPSADAGKTADPTPRPEKAPSNRADLEAPRKLDPRVYSASAGSPAETRLDRSSDASGPEAARPGDKRTYRVAAIGDSLTDPKAHGGKYLAYLDDGCPESRFDAYGKGGEMVNQMRRRFARDVLGIPPTPGKPRYTHVIVFGGVNDLYSDETAGRTVEKIARDLEAMYTMARDRGLEVVAVTVAPWGGFERYYNERRGRATLKLNRWIEAQADAGRIDHVVDAYTLLSCGDSERLCESYAKPFEDGLHFGPAGHERLGQRLFEAVFSDCE